eukprot:Clim_evm18s39 gene=Clim_evmTU18s39
MVVNGENEETVRVVVRVRPQSQRELLDMCSQCVAVDEENDQVLMGNDRGFRFDSVVSPEKGQRETYAKTFEDIVLRCFDGFNASVLAYGQTGSGKTYTMGTAFSEYDATGQQGVIPQAVDHLFRIWTDRRARLLSTNVTVPEGIPGVGSTEMSLQCTFVELYNEEIYDLLHERERQPPNIPSLGAGHAGLKLREDDDGITIQGVNSKTVHTAEDVFDNLQKGILNRKTASTNMNISSSRSHAIFTLYMTLKEPVIDNGEIRNWVTRRSKINFVDLAGSERLKRTRAEGNRAKEGIAINYGLLALGNVISALGDTSRKVTHVPYRDSKLTRLLQDSLGGNSRTVMVACISPSDCDFTETLNTLKYANRARNIVNKVVASEDSDHIQIRALQRQVQQLTAELLAMKGSSGDGNGITSIGGEMYRRDELAEECRRLREENRTLRSENRTLRERLGLSVHSHAAAQMSDTDVFKVDAPKTESFSSPCSSPSSAQKNPRQLMTLFSALFGKRRSNGELADEERLNLEQESKSEANKAAEATHEVLTPEAQAYGLNDGDGTTKPRSLDESEDLPTPRTFAASLKVDEDELQTKLTEFIQDFQHLSEENEYLKHHYEERLANLMRQIQEYENQKNEARQRLEQSKAMTEQEKSALKQRYEEEMARLTQKIDHLTQEQKQAKEALLLRHRMEKKLNALQCEITRLNDQRSRALRDNLAYRKRVEEVNRLVRQKDAIIRRTNKEKASLSTKLERTERQITTLKTKQQVQLTQAQSGGRFAPNRSRKRKAARMKVVTAVWEQEVQKVIVHHWATRNLERLIILRKACVTSMKRLEEELANVSELTTEAERDEMQETEDNLDSLQEEFRYLQESIVREQSNIMDNVDVSDTATQFVSQIEEEDMPSFIEYIFKIFVEMGYSSLTQEQTINDYRQYIEEAMRDPSPERSGYSPSTSRSLQSPLRNGSDSCVSAGELTDAMSSSIQIHDAVSKRLNSVREEMAAFGTQHMTRSRTKSAEIELISPARVRHDRSHDRSPQSGQNLMYSPQETFSQPDMNGLPSISFRNTLIGHLRDVVSLSIDGHWLLSGSQDRTSRLWDLNTAQEILTLRGFNNTVRTCILRNNEAWTCSESKASRWDARTGELVQSVNLHGIDGSSGDIADMIWIQDNQFVLAMGKSMHVMDSRTLRAIQSSSGHRAPIFSLSLLTTPQGEQQLVIGGQDKHVKILDPKTFDHINTLKPPHYDAINCVLVDGQYVWSGSRDKSIKRWSRQDYTVNQGVKNAHGDWVKCIRSLDDDHIITACRSGYVNVWQSGSVTLQGSMHAHKGAINDICVNNQTFVTGSADQSIGIWHYDGTPRTKG